MIYFDDILIFFKNRIIHVNHVKKVLRRLKKFDLYVNLKKCEFFVKKVEYLKFIVSVDDIKMKYEPRPHGDQWRKDEAKFEVCPGLIQSRRY